MGDLPCEIFADRKDSWRVFHLCGDPGRAFGLAMAANRASEPNEVTS
jgi:hypothetical protein